MIPNHPDLQNFDDLFDYHTIDDDDQWIPQPTQQHFHNSEELLLGEVVNCESDFEANGTQVEEVTFSQDFIRTSLKRSKDELTRLLSERIDAVPVANEPAQLVRQDPHEFAEYPPPTKRKRGRPTQRPAAEKRRKYTILTERERGLVRDEIREGKTYESISEKWKVSLGTVSNITAGKQAAGPRGGAVFRKITPDMSREMSNALLDNPLLKGSQLKTLIGEKHDTSVAVSTINSHLKSNKMVEHGCPRFSVKKVEIMQLERNSEETKTARQEYLQRYATTFSQGGFAVFIDETSFNKTCFQQQGRSPLGQRCIQKVRRLQTENLTAITAISDAWGVVHVTWVQGTVSALEFQHFLVSLFEALQRRTNESCTLIMDNVGLHKTQEVKDLIRSKNYTSLYTAPNSCELNPIEYVFGMWKGGSNVPPTVRTEEELRQHLSESLQAIPHRKISAAIRFVSLRLHPIAARRGDLTLSATQQQFHRDLEGVDDNATPALMPPSQPAVRVDEPDE
ncbi:putative DDE superfamily endonuclease [Blattamonas nauphoetae]|uniref:DDE superfamily endonuclease n=1 Tax=Blattamonas nauphoetae TaxID=2049346 RepID=A0ABQ9WUB5_9EUKA|nr:putative DDE superfamily endonuclease [Blattamonas nauphoetae]